MTVLRDVGDDAGDPELDDIRDDVSLELEEVNEVLAALIAEHAERRARDAEILTLRLGIRGDRPETLATIGARFDLARDRIRQVHTKAVGQLLRHAQLTGRRGGVFAERYPLGARDSQLLRTLLMETYATDTDIAAHELSYLKLRLAGHAAEDAKRIAGFVMQRILAWRKKTNARLTKLQPPPPTGELEPALAQVDWPSGTSAPLPGESARVVDADDDGRGRFYLDKVGRDVAFDSGLEARLLRLLTASEAVQTFQETPSAVTYQLDGADRVAYPTVAARLTDGRVLLIDVQPLGHIGFHTNRARSAAARAYAHDKGWGWTIWTGSRLGVPDLLHRKVDAAVEAQLGELITTGPVYWHALRGIRDLTALDLIALTLRHEWRWDRGPFTLTASSGRNAGHEAPS
ncbi:MULTISPECIES: sigma factor-like helix-turn-helix DNA-binding protein [unclassified Nocardia]|uniref:sigma factor-like helix-turn-helix DNA-binding protein n=1 Tax=unclassified Nocardia TaxID=2637762 RepID=UPI001CE3EDF8|nr:MULTISPECIES: sigma factor-like helix-turn-helix DNA-binding protein [unclassified Nocardia]